MENQKVTELKSTLEEASVVRADEVLCQALYSEEDVKKVAVDGLAIKNVIAGIARFNFRGPRWHNFQFDIQAYVKPKKAVVSLGLLCIYNNKSANDMEYCVSSYSLSYVGTIVRVTGKVYVGDSDGYLRGFGFNCTVI